MLFDGKKKCTVHHKICHLIKKPCALIKFIDTTILTRRAPMWMADPINSLKHHSANKQHLCRFQECLFNFLTKKQLNSIDPKLPHQPHSNTVFQSLSLSCGRLTKWSFISHGFPRQYIPNILYLLIFCRLQIFADWINKTERGIDKTGSRYPWISRVKKGGREWGRMSASGNHKIGQGEACFLHPSFLNSLIHGATPPSILVHSRGFNLHSRPVAAFADQFLLLLSPPSPVWSPKCPSLFYKVHKNGEACSAYLDSKSEGGEGSEENESFCKETGRLRGMRAHGLHFCAGTDTWPPICVIFFSFLLFSCVEYLILIG